MIDSFRGKHHFLSNFHKSPITIDGITYPTVEHAFQAAKIPHDHDEHDFYCHWLASVETPMEVKRKGQGVPLRSDWEMVKTELMYQILKVKFSIPKYASRLLATGDEELVEGNNWGDNYWGKCNGIGRNELGKALMRVRQDLKESSCQNSETTTT